MMNNGDKINGNQHRLMYIEMYFITKTQKNYSKLPNSPNKLLKSCHKVESHSRLTVGIGMILKGNYGKKEHFSQIVLVRK